MKRTRTIGIALCCFLGLGMLMRSGFGGTGDRSTRPVDEDLSRFLFYAVLEGLYDDGVQPEVVRSILAPANEGMGGPEGEGAHFIVGCPICLPTRDAFRVYAGAPEIGTWRKSGPLRGFGDGLPPSIVAELCSDDRETRLAALQTFIASCVKRQVERLRLDSGEKARLQHVLEEGRKRGMASLRPAFGKRCPSCEGAVLGGE